MSLNLKKKKILTVIITVVAALIIAAASFAAGYFTRSYADKSQLASYKWALDIIEKNYYYGGVEDGFSETALSSIASKYLDSYSAYYNPQEYAELKRSNAGSKSGLGITYSFIGGKGIFINSVVGNSPAYKSGLRGGEWLESGYIQESDVKTFTSSSVFASLVDGATDGQTITFTSATGKTYSAAKAEYTASYAWLGTNSTAWLFSDSATGGLALYEDSSEAIPYLPDGAAYLSLSQFYGNAAQEVYKLIEKFNAAECTTLILDLRSNGGGYVDVMCDIAGIFADGSSKTAMIARDKYGNDQTYDCAKVSSAAQRVSSDTKVYVLANSGTASASEALIGAMVCYGVLDYGDIFLSQFSEEYLNWLDAGGQQIKTERTYGKGIMQTTFVNPATNEALKLTTAQIYWPDGKTCIHDVGITVKDGCTPVYAEWIRTEADDELKAAAEIIKSRQ